MYIPITFSAIANVWQQILFIERPQMRTYLALLPILLAHF